MKACTNTHATTLTDISNTHQHTYHHTCMHQHTHQNMHTTIRTTNFNAITCTYNNSNLYQNICKHKTPLNVYVPIPAHKHSHINTNHMHSHIFTNMKVSTRKPILTRTTNLHTPTRTLQPTSKKYMFNMHAITCMHSMRRKHALFYTHLHHAAKTHKQQSTINNSHIKICMQ